MPAALRNGVDRDIYQIVKKLESVDGRLSTLTVYDHIKGSNSSLARQRKRPLEDAIDRVLAVRKDEKRRDKEDEDSDAAIERALEMEEHKSKPKNRDTFLLNKQITKAWDIPRAKMSTRMDIDSEPQSTRSTTTTSATIERQSNGEPKPKRRKPDKTKDIDRDPPTDISLSDFGGIQEVVNQLMYQVAHPLFSARQPEYRSMMHVPRGILLHGPPGCGKTTLVRAVAAALKLSFIPVSAPTVVAGMSGESEKKIRDAFEEARKIAPCLLFFDEVDVIMGKRETAQREMEKRMVAQMGTAMDDITSLPPENIVLVFGATSRPDQVDDSLRRGGRFEMEIAMGMPNEPARESILRTLSKDLPLGSDIDFTLLAKRTPGFVGADLKAMVGMAKQIGARRLIQKNVAAAREAFPDFPRGDYIAYDELLLMDKYSEVLDGALPEEAIEASRAGFMMDDFAQAIGQVQPMAKREGFTAIPDTTWDQVGALREVRQQLSRAITGPIANPEIWAEVGITSASGVLLWGPPGCGKTLLAKAVANEAKANFISIKGPELLNKYVGESERSVRQLFARARQSQPCVLFFDELDSLVPSRDDSTDSSHRVVNAMLTELDGMDNRKGVYIIAATNRPDRIDQAILRPGRLGTLVFVDLPTPSERAEILGTIVKTRLGNKATEQMLADVNHIARSDKADGFSGADLENLHVEAANHCIERCVGHSMRILSLEDWEYALGHVRRSVQNPDYFRIHLKKALERQTRH